MEQVWETTECFTTACFTLHLVHGTARHANTFCRETTHTTARPANTSTVLRVPAQNGHNVSPTIHVTTQTNTSDCCQQVAFKERTLGIEQLHQNAKETGL